MQRLSRLTSFDNSGGDATFEVVNKSQAKLRTCSEILWNRRDVQMYANRSNLSKSSIFTFLIIF